MLFSSLGKAILIRGMDLEGGGTLFTTKIPLPVSNEPFVLGRRKNKEEYGRQGNKGAGGNFLFPGSTTLEQCRFPIPVFTPSCSCGGPDLCKSIMESNRRMS